MKKAYNTFIIITLIIWTTFFSCYRIIPFIGNLYWVDVVTILSLVFDFLFLLYIFIKTKKINFNIGQNHFWSLLVLLVLITYITSLISYNQGFADIFKETFYYLSPLFTIFVYFQFPNKYRDFLSFSKIIIYFGLLCSVFAIIDYIMIQYLNINIFNISYSLRYGSARFGVGTEIVTFSMMLSFVLLLAKKNIKLNFFNIILDFIHLIFVTKTRSLIFFTLIVLLIFIIYKNSKIKVFALFVTVILFITYLAFSNTINAYFYSYVNNDVGIMVRFSTIEFYMKQFFAHPFLGMGFINAKGPFSALLSGPDGYFYRDDVGIVGLINQFGLIGLFFVLYLLGKCLNHGNTIKKSIVGQTEIVFSLFLLVTLINLSFLDPQRLLYVWFLLVVDDFAVKHKRCAKVCLYKNPTAISIHQRISS